MSYTIPFKQQVVSFICAVTLNAFAGAPFTVSVDGLEVTDAKTGLIWRRCSEGMVASVSGCSGSPSGYTHTAALAHAETQTGWRLPNIKELFSIVDITRQNPAIDTVAFPATVSGLYWSSTPNLTNADTAAAIIFSAGSSGNYFRNSGSSGMVRLVRAGQ